MNTASLFRHLFTFLAGLGGILLSVHLIAPDQVAAVNKAGADLIAPLMVIIGAVAACVARLALTWISKLFRRGAGENVAGSGTVPLWIVGAAAGLICSALPSCSPETRALLKEYPIKGCYIRDGIKVCASTKSGMSFEVDQSSRK
jgi:hypothetical protein